jgi:hypothetical protein
MKQKPFKLPDSFTNQLQEFTTGFYLVTLNEAGEFETNTYFPTPASAMALLNFLEVESMALQENLRIQAIGQHGEDEDDSDFEDDNS